MTADAVVADVRVLTVRQPHAWAICAGLKTVENRSRNGPAVGTLLAILAGQRYDPPLRVNVTEPDVLIHGAVIGAVTVTDTHMYVPRLFTRGGRYPCVGCDSEWAVPQGGIHHWVLDRAVMLDEPIPMRGSLAFPTAPEQVRAAVLAAYSRKGW